MRKSLAKIVPTSIFFVGVFALLLCVALAAGLGRNTLFNAAASGDMPVLRLCCFFGADVNGRSHDGSPALHYAAGAGKVEAVKYLLQQGADVNATNRKGGMTALHCAGLLGRYEVAEVLLAHGAVIDATCQDGYTTAAMLAARRNHRDVLNLLIAKGAQYSIHDAAFAGDATTILREINGGRALVDSRGRDGNPLLLEALCGCHPALVILLANKGAALDIRNARGETALHRAVVLASTTVLCQDYLQIVDILLEMGADPNARDANGNTPLHHAARYENRSAIKALLQAGADPSIKNDAGIHPFGLSQEVIPTAAPIIPDVAQPITEGIGNAYRGAVSPPGGRNVPIHGAEHEA